MLRPFCVIFDCHDAPATMVGLPSAAERLDLLGQSGSLPFDSFKRTMISVGA